MVSILVQDLCSAVITAFLAGCVVETSGPEPAPVDPVKALEQRVSLARQYIGAGDWENAKRNLELARLQLMLTMLMYSRRLHWFIKVRASSNSPSPISKKRLMPVPDRVHATITRHFYTRRVVTSRQQRRFVK